jgi:hypothetical protein
MRNRPLDRPRHEEAVVRTSFIGEDMQRHASEFSRGSKVLLAGFLGTMRGASPLPFGLMSAVSPLIYGIVRDRTGSYDSALTVAAGLFILGALLLLCLGRYPANFEREND